MVTWRKAERGDQAWDAVLSARPGANIFQSSRWARHKADAGWRPVRALAGPEDAPTAVVQALVKDFPAGTRILWARGGPLGEPSLWNAELRKTLADSSGGLAAYGRICSYRESDPASVETLEASGWLRPEPPLDRGGTHLLDLAPEPEALREGLSSNWRHNLKRGLSRAEAVNWPDPDPAEMEAVYRALETLKGLPPQHRAGELGSLVDRLGDSLILRRVVLHGRTVAFRACALWGGAAVDLLAAATEEARKIYASYALLWSLILESRRRGARTYDLGGSDPTTAPGVADFKKGLGARPLSTLGEWDFAAPRLLRRPAGALIAWKLGKEA